MKYTIVLGVFVLVFLGVTYASELHIDAPNTIHQWCFQPYIIKLDANNIATKSVDVKLFLTGYFGMRSMYSTISDMLNTETWHANYIPWDFVITALQTGTATSWSYQNRPYLYINAYQFWWASAISQNNFLITTIYLKAKSFTTWYLDFYFINWRNGDDSNVSSGINEWIITGSYTQYLDALTGVQNLEQTFDTSYACSSRPYISKAYYRQTGYISTSTGVQAVRTSVIAWPEYSGTANRTLRTKWNVTMEFTGVSDSYPGSGWLVADNLSTWIQLTYVSAFDSPYISLSTSTTWWFTNHYDVSITWNVTTGFVGFDNIIENTWSTYTTGGNNYTDTFMVDVFWIDTVTPTQTWYFTGYVASTWAWFTQYTLSGTNFAGRTSNPTNGFHANWTDMDDQYKVISFSWTNSVTQDCTDTWYPCTTVGYMEYLNTTWYVVSGNNVFKLIHNIHFTNSFNGYVTVIDRAGNTWQRYINVNMDDLIEVNYWLIAYPQAWVARNELIGLSGMLIKLAIYSGWFDKNNLLNWLIYTGFIKTSNTGWATFTGNFASGEYRVLAEWMNTLSYLLTWVQLSPVGWTINYTQRYISWFSFGDTYGIVTTLWSKHASYLSDGANRDSIINVADLANLVIIWWEFGTIDTNHNIGVYSGTYFVDIPSNGTWYKIIPYSLLQSTGYSSEFMQYHPYDLNANGLVDVNDYSLANGNYNLTWASIWWRLDWTMPATMPF